MWDWHHLTAFPKLALIIFCIEPVAVKSQAICPSLLRQQVSFNTKLLVGHRLQQAWFRSRSGLENISCACCCVKSSHPCDETNERRFEDVSPLAVASVWNSHSSRWTSNHLRDDQGSCRTDFFHQCMLTGDHMRLWSFSHVGSSSMTHQRSQVRTFVGK